MIRLQARAARNPDNAPHLKFTDIGGYGYSTVRASPDLNSRSEFVCIPTPFERSETDDGGPLRYRVVHRVLPLGAGPAPTDATRSCRRRRWDMPFEPAAERRHTRMKNILPVALALLFTQPPAQRRKPKRANRHLPTRWL
jgi:hypothetical protein